MWHSGRQNSSLRTDSVNPEEGQSSSGPYPYSMTEQILEKRLHKTRYGNIWRQLFAGFLAFGSACSFGNVLGSTNSITRGMILDDEPVDDKDSELHEEDNLGWLSAIILLGCSIGVITCTVLMRQFGPKRVQQLIGPFYILCWWIRVYAKGETVARFFLGFLGITYFTAGEILMMQTVSYGLRRYLAVLHKGIMLFGVFESQMLGTVVSTLVLKIVGAVIPTTHYVLIYLVPESPVFLYAKSPIAAEKSLKWYRGEDNVYQDMANIKKDWDASRQDSEVYGYMLFHRVVYRPLLVIVALIFFQAAGAYFVFMFYSVETLSDGVAVNTVVDSGIVASYFIASKLIWGFIHAIYSWRVRPSLIISCVLSAFSLGLFSGFLLFDDIYHIDTEWDLHWFPIIILGLYVVSYDMGLNYYPYLLVFEYMPFQMFQTAGVTAIFLQWFFAFILVFVFGDTFFRVPSYSFFLFFSGMTFIGALFSYFVVVEPKGKSLIQIQLAFGGAPIGTRGAFYRQRRLTM